MPNLRLRRIGNSLGIILPKDYVDAQGLGLDDEVTVEVRRATTVAEVQGALKTYGLRSAEWNDLTNQDEDL